MIDNYDEVPGWPQESLPITLDLKRIHPKPIRMKSRRHALDRHARYRERKRLAKKLREP